MFTRLVTDTLHNLMPTPEIAILYGPRRVGKTTLLHMLHDELRQQHAPSVLYTFEDPATQAIFAEPTTDRLERIFMGQGFNPKRRNYLLLDEVQSIENSDLLFKLINDHFPEVKILVASSSSRLVLQRLTDNLAGSLHFIELLPLTLEEITGIRVEDYFSFPENPAYQGQLNEMARTMAVYGAYPEILNTPIIKEKQAKLRNIVESALYKDILLQERLKSPQVLSRLLTLLAYQIGSLIDLNELASQLGISRNTVDQYINLLEKYNLIFRLTTFSRNLRSELSSKFKIYFWDMGVRNALIGAFFPYETRQDQAMILENLVIASIMKRNLYAGRLFNAYFWRTYQGYEIDLVLENNQSGDIWALQTSPAGKASFSKAFDVYRPGKRFIARMENAYQFCW